MSEIAQVFGIDWKLLLIQIVNFGVLLFALWYFLYTPIINLIDERRKKIEEGVINAQRADERLEEIEGERGVILDKATNKAGEIVSTAKERAKEQEVEILKDAHHRAEGVLTDAEQRAEEAKRRALLESQGEIAQAAMLAAEKVLRESK
ncbi:MAG: F0F1 ATP synthase subunit B [bacterium]|nr:F0F1 ATP synthase subunit B [bacterium]